MVRFSSTPFAGEVTPRRPQVGTEGKARRQALVRGRRRTMEWI